MIKKSNKLMLMMGLLLAISFIPFANANNVPSTTSTIKDMIVQTPFLGVNATIPGKIECENYDEGGEGVAFFDTDLKQGNLTYRPDDNVDILDNGQASNGLVVYKTKKNEWLEYTVDVTAGMYDITLSYFCNNPAPGDLELSLDGQTLTTISGVLPQGDLKTQGMITISNVVIDQDGSDKILRVFFPNAPRYQIDALEFKLVGDVVVVDPGACPNGLFVGSSCDDNDDNTINDTVTTDCNCEGVIIDNGPDAGPISGLIMIDSVTDIDIATLTGDDTFFVEQIDQFAVRADVSSPVGSIVFNMTSTDGNYSKKESKAPYALFGDANGNYSGITPSLIEYTLKATAFSLSGGKGEELGSMELSYTFTDQAEPIEVPLEVTDLYVQPSAHNVMELEWKDNSDNEEGFRIEYKNTFGNFVLLTEVGANSTDEMRYTDTQSSIGAYREYRVVAFNSDGLAAPSNTFGAENIPGKVNGFTVKKYVDLGFVLSWDAPNFGNEYELEYKLSENSSWNRLAGFENQPGDYTYTLGEIEPDVIYYRINQVVQNYDLLAEFSDVLEVIKDDVELEGGAVDNNSNDDDNSGDDTNDDSTVDPEISGDLMEWHKVTLTFDGPNLDELSDENPFMDYKMDVTFTSPTGEVFIVPGYFAADGNSENSLATSGDKWRAHISPNIDGEWSYSASFVEGTDVAIDENVTGTTAGFFDGANGTFDIDETNKSANGIDNRGKGRLRYVGEHYLQYEGTGEYFIKVGADAPENMLAYIDFDGTTDAGGKRKDWGPHIQDFDANDASEYTWTVNNDRKGEGMLGSINYLSNLGMNAFSFLTWNIQGDDENVFPQVKINPNNSDNIKWDKDYHKLRMDVSKMAQWEKVFEYGDKKGMFMHFKLMEKENEIFMDRTLLENGVWIGPERKLYYRELIARFGHHLALNWNLGEECDVYSTNAGKGIGDTELESVKEWSRYFKSIDPYGHLVVVHSPKSAKDQVYPKLLGTNSNAIGDITGASLQTFYNKSANKNAHYDVIEWRSESAAAGRKWVVSNDEQGVDGAGGTGVTPDAGYNDITDATDNRFVVRHRALWGTLLAGGAGVEIYYGSLGGCSDNSCEDHRSRENKYLDAKKAFDFFQDNLMDSLLEMSPLDDLASDNETYVFAQEGKIYTLYLPQGGNTSLDLGNFPGTYDIKWYNPVTGQYSNTGTVVGGGSTNIVAPSTNSDWVALITKASAPANRFTTSNINSEVNQDFGLFPNPATDLVTIDINQDDKVDAQAYYLSIRSIVGTVVKEQTLRKGQTEINTRDIAPGIYNVMLFDGRTVQSKKLILMK